MARSPFARRLTARGAEFDRVGDWEVALRFPVEPEALDERATCVADISCLPKWVYYGAEAARRIAAVIGADAAKVVSGAMIGADEGRFVCVIGPKEVLVIGRRIDTEVPIDDDTLFAVDRTGGLGSLALLGPDAPSVLRRLTALDVSDRAFASGRCAVCRIAELRGLLVHIGANSYQLHVDRPDGEDLWDAVLEAGEGLGVRLVGWQAYQGLDGVGSAAR